jgi:hypothetical protein
MMKSLYNLIALVLLIFGFTAKASAWSYSAQSNFPNGIGTGYAGATVPNYTVLTPTGYLYENIAASKLMNGDLSGLSNLSVSTGAYLQTLTGLSNSSGVIFPAVANVSATVEFDIPLNYRSAGVFQMLTHYSGATLTVGAVSLTANVYDCWSFNTGLTSTVESVGTTVFPPTNSDTTPSWVSLTNAQVYSPGDHVTVKLVVSGTSVRVECIAMRFRYQPWGILNGTYSLLQPKDWDGPLLGILKRSRGLLALG